MDTKLRDKLSYLFDGISDRDFVEHVISEGEVRGDTKLDFDLLINFLKELAMQVDCTPGARELYDAYKVIAKKIDEAVESEVGYYGIGQEI